jgi:YbbR domain-containing protein
MDKLLHYLNVFKVYARDYILENTGLKVLALLITAVMWLSVASRPVSQIAFPEINIEFDNLSESPRLTISDSNALVARVFFEGPRDVVDSLRPSEVHVIADMAGAAPGVRVVPLKVDTNLLPANVRVREIEPINVRVTVEPVIVKEVPVKARTEGVPPPGYTVLDSNISPETVRIAGAESEVNKTNEVLTETVSLAGRAEPFSMQVAIDLNSGKLAIADEGDRKVMVTVVIGEVRKERQFSQIPVIITGPAPPGARAYPENVTVTLFGPRSIIDSLKPENLVVSVQYEPGGGATHKYVPNVLLPAVQSDSVQVTSIEPREVRVR